MYRYRYFRTMYDKIVGVAVQKPNGQLIMQIGRQMIEFEDSAPSLEMLHHYAEKISEKPAFKALQIYDVSKIYTTKNFQSTAQLMQEGKNFLVE